MKLIHSLIFLLFLLGVNLYAQDSKSILVSGIVAENDSLGILSNAQIYINGEHNGETGGDGRFVLKLNAGDTLVIEKADYIPYSMVVSDSLMEDYYLLGIRMDKEARIGKQEVILPARFEERSYTSFGISEQELRNATNNLKLSAYTAITRKPKEADAEMIAERTLKKYEMEMGYKGMLSPDDMYSLDIFSAIFLVYGLVRNFTQNEEFQKLKLTKEEVDVIKTLFNHEQQKAVLE